MPDLESHCLYHPLIVSTWFDRRVSVNIIEISINLVPFAGAFDPEMTASRPKHHMAGICWVRSLFGRRCVRCVSGNVFGTNNAVSYGQIMSDWKEWLRRNCPEFVQMRIWPGIEIGEGWTVDTDNGHHIVWPKGHVKKICSTDSK